MRHVSRLALPHAEASHLTLEVLPVERSAPAGDEPARPLHDNTDARKGVEADPPVFAGIDDPMGRFLAQSRHAKQLLVEHFGGREAVEAQEPVGLVETVLAPPSVGRSDRASSMVPRRVRISPRMSLPVFSGASRRRLRATRTSISMVRSGLPTTPELRNSPSM